MCERKIRLTRAGRIWNHNRPAADEDPDGWARPCDGRGEMSVERATALARMEGQLHEAREKEKWS